MFDIIHHAHVSMHAINASTNHIHTTKLNLVAGNTEVYNRRGLLLAFDCIDYDERLFSVTLVEEAMKGDTTAIQTDMLHHGVLITQRDQLDQLVSSLKETSLVTMVIIVHTHLISYIKS